MAPDVVVRSLVKLDEYQLFGRQMQREVRSDNIYFFKYSMLGVTLVKSVSKCLCEYQTCSTLPLVVFGG